MKRCGTIIREPGLGGCVKRGSILSALRLVDLCYFYISVRGPTMSPVESMGSLCLLSLTSAVPTSCVVSNSGSLLILNGRGRAHVLSCGSFLSLL